MKTRRLAALFLLLIIPLSLGATAQPTVFVKNDVGVLRGARITLVKAVPPSSILLYLNNGTLIYKDVRSGARYTRDFKSLAVALEVRDGVAYLVLENGGVYKLSLPHLKVEGIFSLLQGGDEVGVSLASVSGDGRFVAASLKIRYKDITVNRLIVYDTEERKRIFIRDPYSPEKLFKVFSVDFAGNYLVVEDLDTLCELCELTDNYIEVYTVSPQGVEKVSAYRTGLTLKFVGGGYVLAQRVQKDSLTGLYETYLFLLPELKLLGKAEMGQAKSLFVFMDKPYVLAREKSGGYRLVRLTKYMRPASSLKLPLRTDIGFLGRYLVVYTITSALLYDPDNFREVYKLPVNVLAPDYIPSLVDSKDTVSLARYGPNMYVALTMLRQVKLEVKVVADNRPIADASVTVMNTEGSIVATGKTGADGVASFTLKPGEYRVQVSKEGFTEPPPLTILLRSDKKITVTLSEKRIPTALLKVYVDSQKGKPVANAIVKVTGEGMEYSGVTGREGSAVFKLPVGKYVVSVTAPGFLPAEKTIFLRKDATLKLVLRQPTYTLQVNVAAAEKRGDANLTVKVLDANGTLVGTASPGHPLSATVKRGVYKVLATSPSCTVKPNTFIVNSNSTITVTVSCKAPKAPTSLLAYVTEFLANETLKNSRTNIPLTLPTVEAPNGTPVSLADLARGKVLVIEFFYTKCTGCRYLLPALKKLAATKNVQVVSLTVSPADTEIVIDAYRREHGIAWPILRDTAALYQRLNITNYPTVAVYYSGKIVFIGVGSKREVEELAKKPEAVLRLISMAREVLGSDMRRLPEILILVGLVVFLASASRGGKVAKQEDEGEDKGVLLYTDIGDIHSVDSSYGSDLDEALPVEEAPEETGEIEEEDWW